MPNWKKLIVSGSNANLNTLTLNSITEGTTDYNSFLVSDNGEIKFRTGADVLSDIGGVDTSGTPVNNQLAIFTDANTIEGTTALTYNGTTLTFNPGIVDNSIITANTTGITRVYGKTEVQLESDLEVNIGSTTLDYITVSNEEGVIKFPQLGNGFVKQTAGELTIDSSTYSTQTLTLGSDNQIPFMNGTTDFEYSSALTYNDNSTSPTLTIDGTTSGRISLDTTSTSFNLEANNTNETFFISDEIFGEPFFIYDKSGGDMKIKIGDSTGFNNNTHIAIINDTATIGIKNGSLDIDTIVNINTDTDKFLVSDSGTVKYRTGTQLISDIGAVDLTSTQVISGNKTFTGSARFTGILYDANTKPGSAGEVLSSTGTGVSWISAGGTGTVTSVATAGSINGLTLTGGPITTTGTITLGGTLANVTNVQLSSNGTMDVGGVTLELGIGDATPAFDLSSATSYPGDSSLVTLGTITTGTWNGTAITMPYLNFGGTSTQFVKGDGTLDSSTYSTQTLTLGSDNQIPFMNGTTDFEYSSALTYNDNSTSPTLTIDGTASGKIVLDTTSTSFTLEANNTNETFTIADEQFGEPFFIYDKSGGDMLIKIGDSTGLSFETHIEIDGANETIGIKNGSLDIDNISNPNTDTDKFLVSDNGIVSYRTGNEVRGDIGAVSTSGNETIAGIKTFSSFSLTPSSAPTSDYQTANKKYVDDSISGGGGGTVLEVDATGSVNGITLTTSPAAGITGTGEVILGGTLANIANTALSNSTVSYGGVQLSLGDTNATPDFDLSSATNYPTSALVGTITNAQLAGSIVNSKLVNDSVSFGGVSLDLGGTNATPDFDLSSATNYPTSALVGTITNAQLAGSITNSKLSNSTVSYGGVQLSLGGTNATPAFDLSSATSYPGDSSLTTLGTVTSGNVDAILPANALNSLKLVKALSVETIGASENILLWYTTEAITLQNIQVAISQSGLLPTPSVDFNIKSGANRNNLTTSAFSSDQTATAAAGASFTPTTANIAANQWIALTTSAATALTNLDISITCIPQ